MKGQEEKSSLEYRYAYQIAKIERGLQRPIIKTGDTGDLRNFTHVKDVCDAYWKCITLCKKGELYLVGTECRKKYFYIQRLSK